MRIFAYSDTHFALPETQQELGYYPNMECCERFLKLISQERPDILICCGDFNEPYFDSFQMLIEQFPMIAELRKATKLFIAGNHDPNTCITHEIADFLFTHGHKLRLDVSGEDGRQALYQKIQNIPKFVIFGHTHRPFQSKNFIDMGSLSLTGTFVDILDGDAHLREVKLS